MERQLALIETPPARRLDARTKEIGLRGIAAARAALAAAAAPQESLAPHHQHRSAA